MKYNMKLDIIPYEATLSGKKVLEIRLNDEKRNAIKTGDTIEFQTDHDESLIVTVTAKRAYRDIEELVKYEDFNKTGGIYNDLSDWIYHIDKYYSRDLQRKNGILAIEISLYKDS